jgi:Ca2+-binding EF-hand superfamily protein
MHFGIDDAVLSNDELVQLYHGMFARFDHDGNGLVDLEEFKSEMDSGFFRYRWCWKKGAF